MIYETVEMLKKRRAEAALLRMEPRLSTKEVEDTIAAIQKLEERLDWCKQTRRSFRWIVERHSKALQHITNDDPANYFEWQGIAREALDWFPEDMEADRDEG